CGQADRAPAAWAPLPTSVTAYDAHVATLGQSRLAVPACSGGPTTFHRLPARAGSNRHQTPQRSGCATRARATDRLAVSSRSPAAHTDPALR
ncbi:hypothetical protein ABTL15_20410, partial [Acinetobacter baumannii]